MRTISRLFAEHVHGGDCLFLLDAWNGVGAEAARLASPLMFRLARGAAFYADLRSVIETARRRCIRAIDAIRLTLEGSPLPIPA